MDNQEANRPNAEKAATESLEILANSVHSVQNGGMFENHPLSREAANFQQLIPNEQISLAPPTQFGMGHFVTPFPSYMHAVPPGMYSLNMMEQDQTDASGKRRRRTNYRDPENAAKLTTALGILIKQKEENKPQDLKSIASHFGLPYNTLRDNYLKVTTGRLLKDRGDKRPVAKSEGEEGTESSPKSAKKPRSSTSNNSSNNNTPRDRTAPSSSSAHQTLGQQYGNSSSLPPSGAQQIFNPYPVFHPQMGMFMPQMQNMQQMQNIQSMQMQNGGMPAPTMHHPMLNTHQMMHMFAPAPLGYQINPATGRPVPVFAAPHNGNMDMQAQMQAQMHAQFQGQMLNPGMLAMSLPTTATSTGAVAEGEQSPTSSSSSSAGTAPPSHLMGPPSGMFMAPMQGSGPPGMMFPHGMFAAHMMQHDPSMGGAPPMAMPTFAPLVTNYNGANAPQEPSGASVVTPSAANTASSLASAMTAAFPPTKDEGDSSSTTSSSASQEDDSEATETARSKHAQDKRDKKDKDDGQNKRDTAKEKEDKHTHSIEKNNAKPLSEEILVGSAK